jgi:quercetin dioxygenase-like cupin family protein
MDVQPKQPSAKGLAEWFTGDVWIDAIARGAEPSRIRVSAVHFTPGARTAWHSHALGQTLYVTEGAGVVQSRGRRHRRHPSRGRHLHAPRRVALARGLGRP